MLTAIAHLAVSNNEDLTDGQLAYCVGWTWNLHCNCGVLPQWLPTAELERIVEELEAKIDAGPNRATIDWLWDEYGRLSSIDYQRFRPTLVENWSQQETRGWEAWTGQLAKWQSRYEEMASKKRTSF
ncbi:MAG TPA: hypothetical protein DCY13_09630 [Verrucomicrobiales bacterium]|nr:hypothetical protein [Verrucomicrobiales bacterium]